MEVKSSLNVSKASEKFFLPHGIDTTRFLRITKVSEKFS